MADQPTILAIGADRDMLRELDEMLTSGGMRCITVHSLEVALARVKRARQIGAIIVDCEPDSGLWKRVLAELSQPARIPLIVTTRSADETLWSEVLHYGGFDVLARPLSSDEVKRVTASALRSSKRPAGPMVMRAAS